MNVKCKIVYQSFPDDKNKLSTTDYRIFKCSPLQNYDGLVLNNNLQFSIKGDLSYLYVGDEYEFKLEFIEKNQWGGTYKVIECLSFKDLNNLTREDSENILKNMASENNIKTLLDVYPDFINTVLTTDWKETIDVSKLYNIKDAKMNSYVRQLCEHYKYYSIMIKHKDYDLSIKDCRTLIDILKDINNIESEIIKNPYHVLIDLLGRRFTYDKTHLNKKLTTDELICKNRPDLVNSDIRVEYLMLEVLLRNEQGDRGIFKGGSTRLTPRALWDYCKDYDSSLCSRMPIVATECEGIYYDKESGYMARMTTYLKELKIKNFVADMCKDNVELDLEWEKYKEIKDGILTDEQSELLKEFCLNRFIIVDAGGGCGKSASTMALLQMLDDYKISYRCMTATGKSAKRFQEASGGRSCHTIHRDTMSGVINEEVVVIDEDSLLSIELLCMVIDAITNPNVRIVCLGDIQQLLNLSLGTPIKDLIMSNLIKVCLLTKCFRFGLGGIATVSTKCRNGEFYIEDEDMDKDIVSYGEKKDYTYIKYNNTTEQILDVYENLLKDKKCKPKDVWILSPFNVGSNGCLILNNKIQAIVNPPKNGEKNMTITRQGVDICFRQNDIVMNTVNNYNCISIDSYEELLKDKGLSREDLPKEECMNGMSGRIVEVGDNIVKILFDEKIIVFSKDEVKNLVLGYVLNHFKAQGSQNKHIILLTIKEHDVLLNKQCLYTGQTRATDTLIEIGDIKVMQKAVATNDTNSRDTFLPDLLKQLS